jgi:hypothetical protein
MDSWLKKDDLSLELPSTLKAKNLPHFKRYMAVFHEQVYKVLSEITEMLIAKNKKYGNSALEPLGVFSQLSAKEGLLVRIDDKLKRIKNGSLDKDDEDVINDLIGYLVLLKIETNSNPKPTHDWRDIKEKQDLIKKMQQELRDEMI